jgi:calcium/calmodulin-dependent protein kinase I
LNVIGGQYLHSISIYNKFGVLELLTDKEEIHNDWRAQLSKYCINLKFHEEFSVDRILGKGSFARVYKVIRNKDGKSFAVKAFNKEYILKKGTLKSLKMEIDILRKLNHPNIMSMYEVCESDNSIYMITEYIEGGPVLSGMQSRGRKISDEELLSTVKGIVSGLVYLSKFGIMHRDLKPDNILWKLRTT